MYEFLDIRYAKAIFDIAKEKGKAEEFLDQMEKVSDEISRCDDMKIVLDHPNISIKEKKELFKKIWGERVDKEILRFLYILLEKNRIKFLKEKVEEYKKIMTYEKGFIQVDIESYMELNKEQINRFKEIFMKKRNKKIIVRNHINKDLIGGYTIRYEDKFVDYSIRKRIEMNRTL